jgi:hypothetical protein
VLLPVRGVCDCKDVRRHFKPLLSFVQFDDFLCVDRKTFVGVHNHAKEAGVRLEGKKRMITLSANDVGIMIICHD